MFESDLIPLFEKVGTIWEFRLMMDPLTNMNRGYAFITYTNEEDALNAVCQVSHWNLTKNIVLLRLKYIHLVIP